MDQTKKKIPETPAHETVEVLYQKLGSRWFAFSLINDEVFFGSIPEEEMKIDPALLENAGDPSIDL